MNIFPQCSCGHGCSHGTTTDKHFIDAINFMKQGILHNLCWIVNLGPNIVLTSRPASAESKTSNLFCPCTITPYAPLQSNPNLSSAHVEVTCIRISFCRFLPDINLSFPCPSLLEPFQHIYQPHQHWNFNQRPDRAGKCLATASAIYCNHNGNCELEIVACRSETLDGAHTVSKAKVSAEKNGEAEHDEEVHNKWRAYSEHRGNLLDNMGALRCKQHNDRVQKSNQRKRADKPEEAHLVLLFSKERSERQTRYYCCAEGDTFQQVSI
jgi:hypothetical protein